MRRLRDLDYGLTWEEKLERRIKEAQGNQKEAERCKAIAIVELGEIKTKIDKLRQALKEEK